jgi:hypothetical protein
VVHKGVVDAARGKYHDVAAVAVFRITHARDEVLSYTALSMGEKS